ncbi:EamA family transporter [Falsiroseomonas oryzae]|uniref:EamA family transporter n=1 Tax=Falsiroseomonas oryzae TaxID=2766473 RepID=UPI0022EB27CC|nr:EamA family transporter [Roseomonas sp. MO-31]
MDPTVFAAVLAAAVAHAGWNALAKRALDPVLGVTLIVVLAGVVALPFLPVVGLPAAASLPFVAASVALHFGYNLVLAEAYRTGGLGLVYPIARGAAPAIVALAGAVLFDEVPGAGGIAGVALIVAGVAAMSVRRPADLLHADRRAVGFALATAGFIASYTLVDGQGSRLSGNPHGYAVLLFVIDGLVTACFLAARRGLAPFRVAPRTLGPALFGAAMQLMGYWIVIWAMASAPIALVAALRETSVLFAAILAVVVLREPIAPFRLVAAGVILAGALLIRLG